MKNIVVLIVALVLLTANSSALVAEENFPISKIDSSLKQKIEYEAWDKTLASVVAELADKYKVKLYCGSSISDYKIRDQKVNIRVKDITLGKLMASMARTFKMKWIVLENDNSKTSYRIVKDKKVWDKAFSEYDKEYQRYISFRKQAIDSYLNVANFQPQQIEALIDTNPLLYAAAKSGLADDLNRLVSALPGLYNAVLYNKSAVYQVSNLDKNALSALISLHEKLFTLQTRAGINQLHAGLYSDESKISKLKIYYYSFQEKFSSNTIYNNNLGDIYICGVDISLNLQLVNPSSSSSKLMGIYLTSMLEGGQFAWNDYWKVMNDLYDNAPKLSEEKYKHTENIPELNKMINLNIIARNYSSALISLAKTNNYNIVASNHCRYPNLSVQIANYNLQTPDKAINILTKIGRAFDMQWQYNDGIIEMYSFDWPDVINNLLTDSKLMPWRKEAEKNEFISFDTFIQASSIGKDAVSINIRDDSVLSKIGISGIENEDYSIISFYLSLTPIQQYSLFAKNGLLIDNLYDNQFEFLKNYSGECVTDITKYDSIIISSDFKNQNKSISYSFAIKSKEDTHTHSIFNIRKYELLPKKP